MGKKKKEKRVHQNKYESAPRGPKKPGRNSRNGSRQQGTTIDDTVKDQDTPPSRMSCSEQLRYVDSVVGRKVPVSPDTRVAPLPDSIPNSYDSSGDLNYDSGKVQEFARNQGRVRNFYQPNGVSLIVYDERRKCCLLAGSWERTEDFREQMRELRDATGSTFEIHDHEDFGIQTALVYSTDPSKVKEVLGIEADVLNKIGHAHYGNLLTCHNFEDSSPKRKLQNILACYLHQVEPQYFSS